MINNLFLETNKEKLKQIYIKERLLNYGKFGALFIDFSKNSNADIYFLTMDNMPQNVKDQFSKKTNLEQKNTIFLYVLDLETSYIMDVLV